MSKTIVHISSPNGDNDIFELGAPPDIDVPGAPRQHPLIYKKIQAYKGLATAPLSKDGVMAAGKKLYEQLCANEHVREGLSRALGRQPGNPWPIYIQIEDPGDVEMLPWEALYSPPIKDFLALDRRWPIGRIGGRPKDSNISRDYGFVPPLRLLATLAAVGVSAKPEWEALLKAVRAAPFSVSLCVFVCEKDLESRIQSDKQQHNLTVEVRYLTDKSDIVDAVRAFRPHILHFFCHGDTQDAPHLNLATISDWQIGQGAGSVVIESKHLASIENVFSHAWLVTLNCCLGVRTIKNAPSLARSLVDRGFPAVVGMGDIIASDDANMFCELFYSALFADLQAVVAAGGKPVEIELAHAVSQVREELCDKYIDGELTTSAAVAANRKEWMLPILYVQPGIFRLRKRTLKPGLDIAARRALLEQIRPRADLLAMVKDSPGTPPDFIEALTKQVEELESQLFEKENQ
jgi:hypothetical protein